MKKYLLTIIPLIIVMMFSSCGQKVNITSRNTDLPTLSMADSGKSLFYYQGTVDINVPNAGDVSKVVINEIKFKGNKNGVPVINRAGTSYYTPSEIKNIKNGLSANPKQEDLTIEGPYIQKSQNVISVTLQYVILDVPSELKKEDFGKTVSFNMEIYDPDGKKTMSQPVKINIP